MPRAAKAPARRSRRMKILLRRWLGGAWPPEHDQVPHPYGEICPECRGCKTSPSEASCRSADDDAHLRELDAVVDRRPEPDRLQSLRVPGHRSEQRQDLRQVDVTGAADCVRKFTERDLGLGLLPEGAGLL